MKVGGVSSVRAAVSVVVAVVLVITPGCGSNDFLGLEDYQRDLLVGGLAAALLAQQAGAGDQPPGQPIPGEDGLNCWDRNGNGEGDASEDVNGDGVFNALDCQGLVGPPGVDGQVGQDGTDGRSCWDLNGNGVGDPAEDANGDGAFDALDCQGSAGEPGADGEDGDDGDPGQPGQDGPEFFDIFIDDFFGYEDFDAIAGPSTWWLQVEAVPIDEPVLRWEQESPIAYRVAIPPTYGEENDVTMRLFLYRTGVLDGDCFIFMVDARRLREGTGVEVYEHDPSVSSVPGRRWVRVDVASEPNGETAEVEPGTLVVLDLPINTANGLHYPGDLAGGDFLAFELNVFERDGRYYQLLGVEFFESGAGSAALDGTTVFFVEDSVSCGDCNHNRILDEVEMAECPPDDPACQDCNSNTILDECDIRDCLDEDPSCQDCNGNGIPDECELVDNDCNENGIPDDCDGGCPVCTVDADCDDGDPCTEDRCDGECFNDPVDGCPDCVSVADCDDGRVCTEDACDGGCFHHPIAQCACTSDADCPEFWSCVDGICVG